MTHFAVDVFIPVAIALAIYLLGYHNGYSANRKKPHRLRIDSRSDHLNTTSVIFTET